eukprot:14693653-Heterocapsa_arctica.AAC.2
MRRSVKQTNLPRKNLLKRDLIGTSVAKASANLTEANDTKHHLRVTNKLQNPFVIPNDKKVPLVTNIVTDKGI